MLFTIKHITIFQHILAHILIAYDTVENFVNENQNYEIIFDIHRDAVGSDGSYAPTVKIGEEYTAQLMFVIGTDAGGLEHPEWRQNLSFAIKVQKKQMNYIQDYLSQL